MDEIPLICLFFSKGLSTHLEAAVGLQYWHTSACVFDMSLEMQWASQPLGLSAAPCALCLLSWWIDSSYIKPLSTFTCWVKATWIIKDHLAPPAAPLNTQPELLETVYVRVNVMCTFTFSFKVPVWSEDNTVLIWMEFCVLFTVVQRNFPIKKPAQLPQNYFID